jgi:formate dehydrogenase maturation protein FdhE
MAKNGGLTYLNIKNEHIHVCPLCGSNPIKQYVRKYIIIKSGLCYYHNKRIKREFKYVCRRCGEGFNSPVTLQSWLMRKFNEARAKEYRDFNKVGFEGDE